jgi:hypothetical protein
MQPYGPALAALALALGGCAYELEYEPEYLADTTPRYLAETQILVLMQPQDMEYVYEGRPDSVIGETITLRMPIGAITREIVAGVLQSHFNYGVVFAGQLVPDLRYVVAIEPEIRNFSYRYDQQIEEGVVELRPVEDDYEAVPATIITPSIQFELALKAYDSSGNVLLDKVYPSGLVAGESYIVTSRPHERINATFHATLQDIMLTVAEDIRPFLAVQPNIFDPE